MTNDLFQRAVAEFGQLLGAPQELSSGSGVRFVSFKKGRATLYHERIAAGNRAELAIDPDSFGRRLAQSPAAVRTLVGQLRALTGRAVDTNPQHDWPRVGFATEEDILQVRAELEKNFNRPAR